MGTSTISALWPGLVEGQRLYGFGGPLREKCGAKTKTGSCQRAVVHGERRCRCHGGPVVSRRLQEDRKRALARGAITWDEWQAGEARRLRTKVASDRRYDRGRAWWGPGITILFSARLEERFQQDLWAAIGGRFTWHDLPDAARDRARWAWRRYRLDRDKPDAWRSKIDGLCIEIDRRRGQRPAALLHAEASELPWFVTVVSARASAYSKRTKPVTDNELGRALGAVSHALGLKETGTVISVPPNSERHNKKKGGEPRCPQRDAPPVSFHPFGD